MLLGTTIEIAPNTQAVGILVEPSRDELASGYCLVIEPLKERVLFDKWPVTTRQEIDTPLVERPLATRPDKNRYRVQILRCPSIIECYVVEQVVASYRLYETFDVSFDLFVQEQQARFCDLQFLK